ncbi:hypothetical protein BV133_1988 [Blastochloris viridis]|uniref:ChbG/HpnK family deacetylase n=1 Tax=Blastochloris viridis TaxID=1079 RepID=A0A0H5BGR9_BLAVI|nr:hypothetical protein BV133_1988 [Blastochloris viridis]CUU43138.1 hypothetical protein BVIRIDIS_21550 [Blastochloris viridis]
MADDYALAPGLSAAIRNLAGAGRLSATSAMTVAPGFAAEAAPLRALNTPRPFGIGLHLTLTGRLKPLTAAFAPTAAEGSFLEIGALMARAFTGRLDLARLRAELDAQFDAFVGAFGHPPAHVDGHQHIQLLPGVCDVVLDLVAARAAGAWVRQCGPAGASPSPLRDPKGALLAWLSRAFRARADARGVVVNPAFAGPYLYRPGADFAALFPAFLAGLPDGGVVMCHPGTVDAELLARDPLTTHRAAEYAFLAGDGLAATLAAAGAELV